MEVDFTQWWVPAVTMGVLSIYVLVSGYREYRMPALVPTTPEETTEATPEAAPESSKAVKRGILRRTSWIWGSLLIGAAAQAYLSYVAT